MQALQVQFLNPQNIGLRKEATDSSVKGSPDAAVSFQAMIDKASPKERLVEGQKKPRPEAKEAVNPADEPAEEKIPKNTDELPEVAEMEVPVEAEELAVVFGQPVVQESSARPDVPVAMADTDASLSVDEAPALRDEASLSVARQFALVQNVAASAAEDLPAVEVVEPEIAAALPFPQGEDVAEEVREPVVQLADTEDGEAVLSQPVPQKAGTKEEPVKPVVQKKSAVAKSSADAPAAKEGVSVFTVIDERGTSARSEAEEGRDGQKLVAESVRRQGNTLDVSINLARTAEQNILSTSDQAAGATGSTFQQMLANQIQNDAPEFVKAGSIILKDNDTGVINMNLKPESLGNVKISLQVSDKGIEGQIVVASKEAFDAFKQNMDTLRQAFRQNGFENANLNLNMASDADSGQFDRGQQQAGEQYFANKTFGSYAEGRDVSAVAAGAAAAYGNDGYHVDVVA